jgi:hypothetical protein
LTKLTERILQVFQDREKLAQIFVCLFIILVAIGMFLTYGTYFFGFSRPLYVYVGVAFVSIGVIMGIIALILDHA